MSRVDEIFQQLGAKEDPLMADGTHLYKLEAKALIDVLQKMGPSATLYGRNGSKSDMKDALWLLAEPLVKRMMLAPDGKTLLEVHE